MTDFERELAWLDAEPASAASAPQVVSRAGWGARSPRSVYAVAPSARRGFMGHYDGGTPLLQPHSQCPARVRSDQNYHMDGKGWSDIGYNFLVCQHGTAYVGRGWDVVGAHCTNFNTSDIGVQVMIGGPQVPTAAAMATYWWLYAQANARCGRTLARRGHRDGMSTGCPGDPLYALIKAGPGHTAPPSEDDMTPAQDALLKYISKQCYALGELAVLLDSRDAARDAAERAAIDKTKAELLAKIAATHLPT